jgi:hypothetical protein
MANEQNLTQKGKRLSTEEAQRLARRSVEARREKKQMVKSAREFAIAALNAVAEDKNGKKFVVKDAMIKKLIARALEDTDLNAIKYLLELIGESPADENQKADENNIASAGSIDIEKWINDNTND